MLLYREIQLQQYTVITKYQNGLIFRITHMQSKAYWENHKQNSHWEDLCSYYGCYVFLITHIRLPCQTEASHIGIEKAALGILTGLRWVLSSWHQTPL
jgi:hypothetical protein